MLAPNHELTKVLRFWIFSSFVYPWGVGRSWGDTETKGILARLVDQDVGLDADLFGSCHVAWVREICLVSSTLLVLKYKRDMRYPKTVDGNSSLLHPYELSAVNTSGSMWRRHRVEQQEYIIPSAKSVVTASCDVDY
jgi:hypothetical protein